MVGCPTPCQRRLNLDPFSSVESGPLWLGLFGGCGRGDAAKVSVFESVPVSFHGEHVGVVHETIDHGGGHDVIAEDLAPAAKGLVGGDDEAGSFVAGGDQLEEQIGRFGFERDVANFVEISSGGRRASLTSSSWSRSA